MLTPAERNSLLLSLGFLLLGAGIKAWKKWHVEIGPFDPATATASTPMDKTGTGTGDAPPVAPGDMALIDTALTGHRAATHQVAPLEALPAIAGKPARHETAKSPTAKSPTAKSPTAKSPKSAPACPVDPNTASETGLANLPGVGPRTAAALAAYLKAHGPLRDIRELLKVKGIGEKKLALMAPCLIISGAGVDDGKRVSE